MTANENDPLPYLTSEVLPFGLPDDLREVLSVATHPLSEYEVKASLAVEYDRKGYPTRSDVDYESPYRTPGHDNLVLTVEITIPEYHSFDALNRLVKATKDGKEKARREALIAQRDAAQAALDAANKELENL